MSPLLRAGEGGDSQTLAAPMPMRAYRTVHTTGNTQSGGDRGGLVTAVRKWAMPPRDSQPEVIVLSRLLGGALLTEIAQLQPAFFTTLPCDLQELTERILNCCGEQMRAGMDPAMGVDQRIARQLHALGLAARSKGFSYARLGIRRILEDRRLANALTKQLYPEIASHFDTKPACVERAIRSAITAAWQKEGILWQTTLFHQRPTNGEFLTVLADLLREEAAGQME